MKFPNVTKEVESLYTGKASVYEFAYKDNGHGAMIMDDDDKYALVYEQIPCRISYERKETDSQDHYGDISQEIVMFCNPQYTIKPGSKIVFTQAGQTQDYECAGLRAMYVSHQEIKLETFRKRA